MAGHNMPNIQNVKNQHEIAEVNRGGPRGASYGIQKVTPNSGGGVLQLNTESMDRETANTSKVGGVTGSNHKRMHSNQTGYVKV